MGVCVPRVCDTVVVQDELLGEMYRSFFAAHGGLDKTMGTVCKEEGSSTSVCALTRSTGLSLSESLVLVAGGDDGTAQVWRRAS